MTVGARPLSPGSPFVPGLYKLATHGDILTEYAEFGYAPQHLRVSGVWLALVLLVFAATRVEAIRRWSAAATRAVVVSSILLTLVTAWHTRKLPWSHEYVDQLPIVAQLLPVPRTPPDVVFLDSLPVSDFIVGRWCKTGVCSIGAGREGAVGCELMPIIASNGPLVLRADLTQGLWVFDGISQAGPPTSPRAQLPFRASDLSCVWPGAANLRRSVRPPADYFLWSSVFGLVAAVLAFLPKLERSRTRGALAIAAAGVAWILLHPWVWY